MSPHILALAFLGTMLSPPLIDTYDLSRYREFQFGMSLSAVARRAHIDPSEAKVIHQRPAIIQILEWWPQRAATNPTDPVKEILFTFYDGELFRIVVNYDSDRTAGLTAKDMIEAISARYGIATNPTATVEVPAASQTHSDYEKVVARWEDAKYSYSLFRPSLYQPAFGMVIFSKRVDILAQAAVEKAIQLDEAEAPQKKIDRQRKQQDEDQAAGEKARTANKANFRP